LKLSTNCWPGCLLIGKNMFYSTNCQLRSWFTIGTISFARVDISLPYVKKRGLCVGQFLVFIPTAFYGRRISALLRLVVFNEILRIVYKDELVHFLGPFFLVFLVFYHLTLSFFTWSC
jgi:hypothetical protein